MVPPAIRKRFPQIVLLAMLGIVVAAGAWWALQQLNRSPDLARLTVPVVQQTLASRISASGSVVPRQTVNVSPKTAGRLTELYVEQGDRVRQGELIAQMENADAAAQLAQARASLGQAQARLAELRAGTRQQEIAQARQAVERLRTAVAQAQAELELARTRFERNQQLAREGAIAEQQLDEVRNQAAVARLAVEAARASLREGEQRLNQLVAGPRVEQIDQAEAAAQEARARVRAAQIQYNDTFVRAPISGVIAQKYATVGAFVTPTTTASTSSSATSTSIVAIAQGLEVLARVPEIDIGRIRTGQSVEVVVDAYPERVFAGKVRLVAPEAVIEQNVTSFQVRVALAEAAKDPLRSGMNANLVFLGQPIPEAVVVPTVAIVTREGKTGVLVPNENQQPRFRPVTIGTSVGDQTQILKGVRPGERVFIDLPGDQSLDEALKQS